MTVILPGGLGQNMAPHKYSAWSTVSQAANSGNVVPGWWDYLSGALPSFSNANHTVIASPGTKPQTILTGDSFQTSGKRYFEVTVAAAVTDQATDQVGVATSTSILRTWGGSGNPSSAGTAYSGGTYAVRYFGTTGSQYVIAISPANGDVIGVAVDFTTAGSISLYFRFNAMWGNAMGGNTGTPSATFPSAPDFSLPITAGTGALVAGNVGPSGPLTLNTGNAPFANAAPAGYTAWG